LVQICHTNRVLSARSAARWGLLPVIFGLGVLVGRGAYTADQNSLMPVTGVAHDSDGARPGLLGVPDEASPRDEVGMDDESAPKGGAVARSERHTGRATRSAAASHGKSRPAAALEPEPRSWSDVATRAQRGTVGILAGDRYGAGIIVDRSGLVLTNLHVIQGVDKVSVLLLGDETLDAQPVAQAADLDLALLRLPHALPDAAELGSAKDVHVGDEVLAVGSPRKMFFSVSRGMVSYLNRKLDGVEYLQTDLPINAGNSGGPLLDRDGNVIGVVSFILRDSQGIAFALPIDYALERFSAQLHPEQVQPEPARTQQLPLEPSASAAAR
jgi:S1-C subfamily serine protease